MLPSVGTEHGVSSELLTGDPSGRPSPHNSIMHHFRRPSLFSGARAWPPKIRCYFRRLTLAPENKVIFGGH
jgi:hypothetical protein